MLIAPSDDDDIETAIQLRLTKMSGTPEEGPALRPTYSTNALPVVDVTDHSENESHGKTEKGDPACCRNSYGLFDCHVCLEEATTALLGELDEQRTTITRQLLSSLKAAGSKGLSKSQIAVSRKSTWVIKNSLSSRGSPLLRTRLCW